jgi:ribonuclease Z
MDFKLCTLGTSAAGPVPGRWASGQVLQIGRRGFLLDCSEGIQVALQQNGLGWSSIDVILISHLHGDHIYGLPGLLTSWELNQRTAALTLIGPAGLEDFLRSVFQHSYTRISYPIEWIVVAPLASPELVYETPLLTVTTLPLKHRIPTVGYLIREKERPRTMRAAAIAAYEIPFSQIPGIKMGADFITATGTRIPNEDLTTDPPPVRAFAYCSDTAPNPPLIPLLKGVDLLFHEATFLHELAGQAEISGHSTARQAGEVAAAAQVGQLVIGHFSSRYGDLSVLLHEAQLVFPNTALAAEGRIFTVPYQR